MVSWDCQCDAHLGGVAALVRVKRHHPLVPQLDLRVDLLCAMSRNPPPSSALDTPWRQTLDPRP
eukprot:2901007-Rhodomonas_salina.1